MQTRLEAIEYPESLPLRLLYWLTKRKFGKVLTPLKVISSRLPFTFSLWMNKIHSLEKKVAISEELLLLVRIYVAQRNTCSFCVDIKQAVAMQKFNNRDKFFQLSNYSSSKLYSEAEKAAFAFAHALTVHKKVADEVFERARLHYSENQLVSLAWVVSTEHVYNLMNVAFHVESDGLCQLPEPLATSGKTDGSRTHSLQDVGPTV